MFILYFGNLAGALILKDFNVCNSRVGLPGLTALQYKYMFFITPKYEIQSTFCLLGSCFFMDFPNISLQLYFT